MFTKVLIGIDGGDGGRDALALGRLLSAPGADLVLGHVWEHGAGLAAIATGLTHPATAARELLEAERLGEDLDCRIAVRSAASVGAGLHALAEELGCDLLVVGSAQAQSTGRTHLSHRVRSALHGGSCALAVAPRGFAGAGRSLATVGLGHTENEHGAAALATARTLTHDLGATLHVMTVIPPLPSPWLGEPFAYVAVLDDVVGRMVRETREHLQALGGHEAEVRTGLPDECLRDFSARVDLLVLGSRSYGPVRRLLLGSTADAVVRDAGCAVLVLPGPVGTDDAAATVTAAGGAAAPS